MPKTPAEHIAMKLSISGFALEQMDDGSIKAWPRGQDPGGINLVIHPLPSTEEFIRWYGSLKGSGVEKDTAVAKKYIAGTGRWASVKTRSFFAHNLAQWIAEGLD